jgi:hypothetical protein
MRSATRGLEDALAAARQKASSARGKASDSFTSNLNRISKQMVENLFSKLQETRSNSIAAIDCLSRLFLDKDLWTTGLYSNSLIDSICRLIFKLIALGKLCPTKNAVTDDLSILQRLTTETQLEVRELRIWISSPNYGRMELLTKLDKVDYGLTALLF